MKPKPEILDFAAQGGRARAERLSPEQRRDIARQAAEARWSAEGKLKVLRATHEGPLEIAAHVLPCAVLEDGTRVLSRFGFMQAIGRTGKAKGGRRYDEESKVPVFLTAENLKPFVTQELLDNSKAIPFRPLGGGGIAMGYRAELLTQVCNVFINAKFAGVLKANQEHIALRCKILSQGFALVGITALIDEATGYQDVRARDALAKILEAFVTKELRRWVSTFPPEYYKELFRLRGWQYPTLPQSQQRRPMMAGKITNDIVYARLAPGVRQELHRLTPRDEKGRLKHKLFQRLTERVGHPKLREHLASVVTLMRASDNWADFMKMLDRALPKYADMTLFDTADN
jgi:hypothetical protein